jgi:hypothetical protein
MQCRGRGEPMRKRARDGVGSQASVPHALVRRTGAPPIAKPLRSAMVNCGGSRAPGSGAAPLGIGLAATSDSLWSSSIFE